MNKLAVGVSAMSLHYGSSIDVFRRNCLFFEKIFLAGINHGLEILREESMAIRERQGRIIDGLTLMLEKGIVADAPDYSSEENLKKMEDIYIGKNRSPGDLSKYIELNEIFNELNHFQHVAQTLRLQIDNASRDQSRFFFSTDPDVQKDLDRLMNEYMRYHWAACLAEARCLRAKMRLFDDADAVCMDSLLPIKGLQSLPQDEVLLQLCLQRFPIPREVVPLDEILDLRDGNDWKNRVSLIRSAISTAGDGGRTTREVSHEISQLVYELELLMNTGGLVTENAQLTALVAASEEILHEIVRSAAESAAEHLLHPSVCNVPVTKQETLVSGRLLSCSITADSSNQDKGTHKL